MFNNKKGQFQVALTLGMVIVAGIVIVLLMIGAGLLLNWLKTNVFLIVGASVLILTLVFGIKPVLKDPTPARNTIFTVLLLLGAGLLLFNYTQISQSQTTTFFDKDFGLITQKTYSAGFLTNFFASTGQIYYPDKTAYSVGQTITGKSAFFCMTPTPNSPAENVKVELLIYRYPPAGQAGPPQQTIMQQTTTASRDLKYVSWSVPTSKEGVYKIYDCWTCTTDNRRICSDDGYTREIQVTQVATSCPVDYNRGIKWTPGTTTGVNFIRWTEWDTYKLSNGQCVQTVDKRDYMTVCNDGYVCSGTQSQECSGQTTCAKAITTPPVNPECNADLTITCSSGSSVVTRRCIDGKFYTTGNTCPEAKDQCSRDETSDCPDGSSVVTAFCSGTPKVLTSTGNVCANTSESCHSKSYTCGTFNGVNCGTCLQGENCISNKCVASQAQTPINQTSCESSNTCSVTGNDQQTNQQPTVEKEFDYTIVFISAVAVIMILIIVLLLIKSKRRK